MTSTNEFVIKINNTKFDEIAYRMISENEIYGLVNFDVEKSKIETVVQYINDKYIPLILMAFSIAFSIAILGLNVDSVIQGILIAGTAVLSNQLVKQSKKEE